MLNVKSKFYLICEIILIFCYVTSAQETAPISKNSPQEDKNLIHFGDLIDVDILGSTEFDWRGTLNPEGFLDGIDFVEEPIYALCQDEKTIADAVARGYSKLLRNPQVVIKILDRSGRAVSYLYGAVKTPQRFQIQRSVRLSELLILAGGIDEKASGEIQILRTNRLNCFKNLSKPSESSNILVNQKEISDELIKLNISEIIKGGKESNPLILNGDIITVTEADPIYVIGGVSNPKKINARTKMTVSRAIASAGGLSKNADVQNIAIFRRNKGETVRIEVNLDLIKTNEKADLVLQKFDILEIGVSGVGKSRFNPVIRVLESQSKPLELPLRLID